MHTANRHVFNKAHGRLLEYDCVLQQQDVRLTREVCIMGKALGKEPHFILS